MINRNSQVARGVRYALYVSAVATAATSLPALAQDQQEAAAGPSELGTVVVTGSRIPQPNLTSISPVTAVGTEEIKIEGVTRVEDLINNLPQAFADFGGNVSNGSTGTATVNLRGLGSQRTLVLVNSRRLMPGDPTQNGAASPDLNQIPARADRARRSADGRRLGRVRRRRRRRRRQLHHERQLRRRAGRCAVQLLPARQQRRRHRRPRARRGFAVARRQRDRRLQRRTSRSSRASTRRTDAATPRSTSAIASSTRSRRTSATSAPARSPPGDDVRLRRLRHDGAGVVPDVQPERSERSARRPARSPWTRRAAAASSRTRDLYNFAPPNYYQRPDERKTAGLFAHYDFSDKATVYTEFMFMDDRTDAQIAPSGAFLGSGPGQPPFFGSYAVNCDNPLLSPSAVAARSAAATARDAGRRPARHRPAQRRRRRPPSTICDTRRIRGVLGLRGDIADGWNYDVYGLYGTSILSENYPERLLAARALNKALTAPSTGPGHRTAGVPRQRRRGSDERRSDLRAVQDLPASAASRRSSSPICRCPASPEGATVEQILSGSISGDLGQYGLKLPTAERRPRRSRSAPSTAREESDLRTDQAFQTGDLAGQGAPTLDTTARSTSRRCSPKRACRSCRASRSPRRCRSKRAIATRTTTSASTPTPTSSACDWAPVERHDACAAATSARCARRTSRSCSCSRACSSTATPIRAANALGETPEASLDECARTGVTAAQYGNILAEPGLRSTTAWSAATRTSIRRSRTPTRSASCSRRASCRASAVTVDYFDIKVDKLINSLGADFILNQCLTAGDPTFCDRVHRAANGSIWLGEHGLHRRSDPQHGLAADEGHRYRDELSLRRSAAPAASGLQLIGTYIDEFLTEPLPGASKYDCVGLYGTVCGTPIPEWRHKLRATWTTPWNMDLSLTWRYIAAVDDDRTSSDPKLASDVHPDGQAPRAAQLLRSRARTRSATWACSRA